jgi:hypothetical protein
MTDAIDTPAPAPADTAPAIAQPHAATALPNVTGIEAQRRLDGLIADRGWGAKYLLGDAQVRKEYAELQATIEAREGDRVAAAVDGTLPPPTGLFDWQPHHVLTQTVGMLRDAGINDATIAETLNERPVSKAEFEATKILKNQKFGDAEWVKRYLAGGYTEKREAWLMSIILSSEIAP